MTTVIKEKKYLIYSLIIVAFLMQAQTLAPMYFDIIKANGRNYLILFILLSLTLHILIKQNSNINKYFLIIIFATIAGFYTNYQSLLISIFYFIFILAIGSVIAGKINEKRELINIITYGYCICAYIWNVPYLLNEIPFKEYYVLSIGLGIMYLFINRKEIKIPEMKNYTELSNDSRFYLLIILYILASSITSFMWDDLNAYIYFPLKSLVENKSALSQFSPGSLIFQSLHSLSFTAALGIWSSKDYNLVYYYKFFNLISYILVIVASWDIFNKIYTNKKNIQIIFYTIATSTIWFINITSNYTDLPVFLLCIYSLNIIIKEELINLKLKSNNYIFFSIFTAITLKSLVIIIPIVALDLYNKLRKNESIISVFIIPTFILPIFIRNYIYTGNPTFPAGNNIWKSEYFDTDKNSIIVGKFWPSNPIDINLFFNFFSGSSSALTNFYGGIGNLYSPVFYFGISLTFLFIIFKIVSFKTNKYIILGVVFFFLTVYLPGAQHRYFIGSYLFLLIGMIYLFDKQIVININNKVFNMIIYIMIFLFPTSQYVTNKLYINEGKVFSKNGFRDWNEKIIFYDKVNDYFKYQNKKPKILIHYLQDKLFLINAKVVEFDWYDHNDAKGISKIMSMNIDEITKREMINEFICNNNFNYLVLSDANSIFIKVNDKPVIKGVQQSLYKIDCKGF
jgi:hypothetical protein